MKFVAWSSLTACLVFSSITFGHGDIENRDSIEPAQDITNSRQAFRQLIRNPVIRDAFTYVQQELIPTKTDSRIRNFFRDNQFLGQLYQAFVNNEDENLNAFAKHASATMMRIRKNMGSNQAREIHGLVVELAKNLGFSDLAIENIEIYVTAGDRNAFTVSASKHRIVIVFQSELLKSMTKEEILHPLETQIAEIKAQMKRNLTTELDAIAGHELGHIILAHSTVRRMNVFMINLLKMIFIQSPEGRALVQANMANDLQNNVCSSGCKLVHNFAPLMKLTGSGVANGVPSARQVEMQAVQYLSNNPRFLHQLLIQYLIHVEAAMDEYLAPQQAIDAVRSYRAALVNALRTGDDYIPARDAREFIEVATHLLYAFSRSQETSSDRISDSAVQRKYLASAFIRILELDKFDIKDRQKLIDQIVVEGHKMLDTSSREELAQLIGSTHPSPILRIFQMTQMPSYPAVIMAHPFVKLLALNQYMMMEKAMTKEFLASATAAGAEAQSQREFAEKHLQEIAKAGEEVITTILYLLKYRTVEQKKHPRLANLIQYVLIQREQQLTQIQDLKNSLAQAGLNPQEAESLRDRLRMFEAVFLPQSAEFLARVTAELNTDALTDSPFKSARLKALDVAAHSMDLNEVKRTRSEMLILDPNRNWTKDPVADLNAPDFPTPRELQIEEGPKFTPRPPTPSLLRSLGCEAIVRGV